MWEMSQTKKRILNLAFFPKLKALLFQARCPQDSNWLELNGGCPVRWGMSSTCYGMTLQLTTVSTNPYCSSVLGLTVHRHYQLHLPYFLSYSEEESEIFIVLLFASKNIFTSDLSHLCKCSACPWKHLHLRSLAQTFDSKILPFWGKGSPNLWDTKFCSLWRAVFLNQG